MALRVIHITRRYPLPSLVLSGLIAGLLARYLLAAPAASQTIWQGTLVIGGLPVVVRTGWGMLHGKFAADIVASLAIVGAVATQEFFAGCVIVLMQTGGEALEDFAVRRASSSLEALLARAPKVAHRREGEGFVDISIEAISPGDRLLVRPGEVIPVDGTVLSGTSAVDESALTGEPVPVAAGVGTEVMSGSISTDGAIEIQALRPSGESQYEQIVRLVREAQTNKAPLARLADRYAIGFTPVTFLLCGAAYLLSRNPDTVVAVLVVATPCPLILATPVAIISGINRAARHGIIVKHGVAIERMGEATAVVFDKTGTITAGTPAVERVVRLDGYSEEEIVRLAAGLEQLSTHPMARSLAEAGLRQGPLPAANDLIEMAGQGVSGQVEGHTVDVGSGAYAELKGLLAGEAFARVRSESDAGAQSIAVVGIDHHPAGLVIYADPLRPSVGPLLARLSNLGVTDTVMLTGDDWATAQNVAAEVGITSVHADLLPAQKVNAVHDLMEHHRTVVMVGDGINDAPALAAATVGIALGAHGAAVSAEAADVVITTDDLGRVADGMQISRDTLRIARQSIWVGLGLSTAMMVVAALGFIPVAFGALLQEVLDVTVILNALRARSG